MTQPLPDLPWLDPPYNFLEPEPDQPFTIDVIRYQVGLSQRPIEDPPGSVVRPTIRFHLPAPLEPGHPPYVDFTNRILIQRILALYNDLIDEVLAKGDEAPLFLAQSLAPSNPISLRLRLTRHGRRLDTRYDVDIVR